MLDDEQELSAATCAHRFALYRWTRAERWRCVKCGFITRSYDSVDGMGQRPIHPHMSVAMRGFNTTSRWGRRDYQGEIDAILRREPNA